MGGLVPSNYLVSAHLVAIQPVSNFSFDVWTQTLEDLIKREKLRLEKIKSKFPVIHASRLKQLMDESGLSNKMDKAQTEQVKSAWL